MNHHSVFYFCHNRNLYQNNVVGCKLTPGGGGVLPYVTLTGTCGPIGYGFQGVFS